ncbi:hypothetical protein [Komagataeibacter sp. FXV3]|uniref:hypothetical protein n=1 Tax=Komagataeibacter sp. FXV3 TaxID=2608998 RepID=UPI00187B9A22|nr:hypothetical protein [Komagataeibacter sp. FXV3]MBE7729413.1 hypothetical protein [Komagataeibacter sp. FXV3]
MGTPNPIRRPDRFDAGKYWTQRETAMAISQATAPLTSLLDDLEGTVSGHTSSLDALNNKTADLSTDGSTYSGEVTGAITGVFDGTVQIGTPPASATATGTPGQIIFAATGIYLCTATNSWVCFTPGAWPTS